MKKMAFFVEGETEYYFISKLLKEIAGVNKINIRADKLQGGGKKQPIRSVIYTLESTINLSAKFEVLIRISGTDHRVDTDIKDFHQKLKDDHAETEYSIIVGLRDLRGEKPDHTPNNLSDLPKMELLAKVSTNQCVLRHIISTNIIIVVYEIEAWFLAECSHFQKIDNVITNRKIITNLGFDPCCDDMTLRPTPVEDLNNIYHLGIPQKAYNKELSQIQRTVNYLDYANLYLIIKNRIPQLKKLIDLIDNFLS